MITPSSREAAKGGAAIAAHFAAQRAALRGRPIALAWLWCRALADLARQGISLRLRFDRRPLGGDAMLSDFRTAARMLWRSPGYALVVVLTLGLGIGGVTAVFTLADPMIFRPLPWTDANRIVEVRARHAETTSLRLHADDFVLIEREATSFVAVATLNGPYVGEFRDRRDLILGNGVSKGFFPMTGLVLAFWWSESVRAVIVGVDARDPWSFAGAAVATLATVAVASLRPAIRASRIDPARTLRAE